MFAGIDIGSVTTKAVILDQEDKIRAFSYIPTSADQKKSGEDILSQALEKTGESRTGIKFIVSTGYGRRALASSNDVSPEIICHAVGTRFMFPDVRTIIDIGGQDSKIIVLDEKGNISKFEMNDKCAAGTGRFLEVLSERILNISIEELGEISLKSRNPSILSSVCTIFAESEVISYLSENRSKEDIAAGLHRSIAKRVIGMGTAGSIDFKEPVIFSGGVARNVGVIRSVEEVLGKKVTIPEDPQITAALGAAVLAKEKNKQVSDNNV
jgi:predicted CoA-substrate-specific enzyme activase